ncbi:MAG: D-alanine--D-alanine ligase [Candidatus Rariloculaceae bacterium]
MKIAVLLGGTSMERDVSVASGTQVISALRSVGHEVIVVESPRGVLAAEEERELLACGINAEPPRNMGDTEDWLPILANKLQMAEVDLVFLALHGGWGEDGTIQAVFEKVGLPYTGSNKLGSRLAMDKNMAKKIFCASEVPTPKWLMAPASIDIVDDQLGFPVIVKPNSQGSTVGLTLVKKTDDLQLAITVASEFDNEVMVERYISGRELTVGILDGETLAVGEIIPAEGDIFDYAAKYQVGAAQEIFPAIINQDIEKKIRKMALLAHKALELGSYSRVDFRMDSAGDLWVLEVNTLPGLSSGSLLPKSAEANGVGFVQLCERICRGAIVSKE